MDSNSNERLKLDFRYASKSSFFYMLNFVSSKELKMLNLPSSLCKKIQPKNEFFCTASKYGMALLICKKFRKNNTW